MRAKRVQLGAEPALNLRSLGCHVNEDKPRGAFSTGLRELRRGLQTAETLGLGLAGTHHHVYLTAQGASFPSCRPVVGCRWQGCLWLAAAVHLGWRLGMDGWWWKEVGEKDVREATPAHLLQISVRLSLQETP